MAGEDSKFEEFRELIKELSNIEAKILKLEERKNTVRDSVYQKVKDDYQTKLQGVENEIENRRAYIEKAFDSCRSEIEDLVNKRNGIEEELEELSLRDYLGEFEEGEHARLCQEKKDQLNDLVEKLEDATKRIHFLQEFLPDSLREMVPEEVVSTTFEEPPAESLETPAESDEIPSEAVETTTESAEERSVEFAGEATEPSETPAEQVEASEESAETSVEWQESPGEKGAEEEILVDMVATGTHDSRGEETATEIEETADESVEMLSPQEADEIIEEKISPVDKSAEILKQPELGPDAHEREGVDCPKCGMMNEPDSWYCEKCGAELLVEGTG
jgi:uncharacterized protein YdcH (DUF465 family)